MNNLLSFKLFSVLIFAGLSRSRF